MGFQHGNTVCQVIDGIVHQETQERARRVDLTVNSVYELEDSGSLDFGGSEFRAATKEPVEPTKKNPEDDYGWWHLDPGTYFIEYNETIDPGDGVVLLIPLQRLIEAGATHTTQSVTEDEDDLLTLLEVGSAGCNLKENCRVSGAYVLETT